MKLISKALMTACVKGITQLYLSPTRAFIHERNEPSCLYSQPQSITSPDRYTSPVPQRV